MSLLSFNNCKIGAYGAALGAAAIIGCNSDDREQLEAQTTGTTGEDDTVIPTFTTAEPVDTTGPGEVPVPEVTCRDAIGCAVACALAIPSPTGPEDDWQACFVDMCFELLTTEEWLDLFDLGECVVVLCSETPECMSGSEECNACYLTNLSAVDPFPLPVGCEAEAMACE